jgi:hypothetical protein
MEFVAEELVGETKGAKPAIIFHPLIVVGFYSEVALQKPESEGTVGTKHQLNPDSDPEGTRKNLDDRWYGGREEQRIPGVEGGAGAAQGVLCYLRALGDRTGLTVVNDSASVPEVQTPAKLEGVLAVVVIPHLLDPAIRPKVGDALHASARRST